MCRTAAESKGHSRVQAEGGLHGQHDEGCHRVRDGQLSGSPGHQVVHTLESFGRKEVMSVVVPHLQMGGGCRVRNRTALTPQNTGCGE